MINRSSSRPKQKLSTFHFPLYTNWQSQIKDPDQVTAGSNLWLLLSTAGDWLLNSFVSPCKRNDFLDWLPFGDGKNLLRNPASFSRFVNYWGWFHVHCKLNTFQEVECTFPLHWRQFYLKSWKHVKNVTSQSHEIQTTNHMHKHYRFTCHLTKWFVRLITFCKLRPSSNVELFMYRT